MVVNCFIKIAGFTPKDNGVFWADYTDIFLVDLLNQRIAEFNAGVEQVPLKKKSPVLLSLLNQRIAESKLGVEQVPLKKKSPVPLDLIDVMFKTKVSKKAHEDRVKTIIMQQKFAMQLKKWGLAK